MEYQDEAGNTQQQQVQDEPVVEGQDHPNRPVPPHLDRSVPDVSLSTSFLHRSITHQTIR